MPAKEYRPSEVGRREFLKFVGAAGAAAGTLPLTSPASADGMGSTTSMTHPAPADTAVTRPFIPGYEFFNVDESAFIEAAVDTLIPHDTTGPGARELGVAVFIDRQMASGYGKGDRLYLEGPYGAGTPEQGYQLAMTPSELVRAGIADVNVYVEQRYKSSFAALGPTYRAAVMADLDGKKVDLATVPSATFFGLLLQLTIEGYFADPMYGGNKGKAAWTMIGFPGADAMYMDKIEAFRNRPYMAEPKGIRDLI
jgi:gluconate 2-dehydrogenase gamma chain